LKDVGYEVNLDAADPYSAPTGGSTALVQQSSGNVTSGSAALRSYSRVDSAQVWSPMEASVPSQPTARSLQPVRRPVLSAASTRYDKDVVDAALTVAYRRGHVELSDDVFESDEMEVEKFNRIDAIDLFFAQPGISLLSANAMSTGCI
jgi:hypothetical protein